MRPQEHPINQRFFEGLSVTFRPTPTGQTERPALLLHGAGNSTKQRSEAVSEIIGAHGVPSVAFDHTGHGESSGTLAGQSLAKRLVEAHRLSSYYDCGGLLAGFSMGGHTALELALLVSPEMFDRILLFYPAIYPDEAENAPFGSDFTTAIRAPNAWKQSRLFDALTAFDGKLAVIIGELDEVIPPELPDMLLSSLKHRSQGKISIVPKAPHLLLPHVFQSPELVKSLESTISWILE